MEERHEKEVLGEQLLIELKVIREGIEMLLPMPADLKKVHEDIETINVKVDALIAGAHSHDKAL